MRSSTDYIIIHCSATHPGMNIGVAEIRALHASPKGTMVPWNGGMIAAKGWNDVGYHYVITRGGKVQLGRPMHAVGAHARGFNRSSVGICLVGGVNLADRPDSNFTRAQWQELETLVYLLKDSWPHAAVIGHRDLPGVAKPCPGFDAPAWWKNR